VFIGQKHHQNLSSLSGIFWRLRLLIVFPKAAGDFVAERHRILARHASVWFGHIKSTRPEGTAELPNQIAREMSFHVSYWLNAPPPHPRNVIVPRRSLRPAVIRHRLKCSIIEPLVHFHMPVRKILSLWLNVPGSRASV
jgi:hypothetical protein